MILAGDLANLIGDELRSLDPQESGVEALRVGEAVARHLEVVGHECECGEIDLFALRPACQRCGSTTRTPLWRIRLPEPEKRSA